MIDEDDRKLSFVSLEELTTPASGTVLVNHYWSVHPTKGVIFYMRYSPQCNSDERITNKLQPKLYPWAEVQLIPTAYIPRRHIAPGGY